MCVCVCMCVYHWAVYRKHSMLGEYVEMTYLWEKDISFFTSESPFPSVQDNFWGLGIIEYHLHVGAL